MTSRSSALATGIMAAHDACPSCQGSKIRECSNAEMHSRISGLDASTHAVLPTPLPTQPGIYSSQPFDVDGYVYRLYSDGVWMSEETKERLSPDALPRDLVRLVPVRPGLTRGAVEAELRAAGAFTGTGMRELTDKLWALLTMEETHDFVF